MKIAVLSSHTPSLFWFRIEMMQAFMKRGHEVIAIGNEEEEKWRESFNSLGIRYIHSNISRNGTNPLKDLATLKDLKRILKKEKPDKLFTFQAKTVIYGGIAAHSLGIKDVYPLIAGVGSVFLSDSLKARVIRTILKTEYKDSLRHATKYFFQNPDDVKVFSDNGLIDKEKVVMLGGSGVNTEKFAVEELPETIGFLFIGRLIKDKGIMEYLDACREIKKKYPDVRCLLVGPYDSNPTSLTENELKSYIDDGIIEYFGEQGDVRPYLKMCSVYVLPSYREGTPKTVLEAMSSGRAIITTDAPGCRETVRDGVNGYLVPVKDTASIVSKMEELILNPKRIEEMGMQGRKVVEERFDVNIVNNTICNTMEL